MMREIVDHHHATPLAANFLAPLDAFEGAKAVEQFLPFDAEHASHGVYCERVLDVVPADERSFQGSLGSAPVTRCEKTPSLAKLDIARGPIAAVTIGHLLRPRRLRNRNRIGIVAAHNQRAVGRNDVNQPTERALDVIEIAIDVSVVELNAGEDHVGRSVVEKFRTLIEKGGVVLIALEHDIVSRPRAPAAAEIKWHPTDE